MIKEVIFGQGVGVENWKKGAVATAAVMSLSGAPRGSGIDVYLEMTEDMTVWGPDRLTF